MNKENKSRLIIISTIIAILIMAIVVVVIIVNVSKKKEDNTFKFDNDLLLAQKQVDDQIKNDINDKKYTLNDPKVLVNPYKISPLSALVIFKTKKDVSFDIYINDKKFTTTDSSKEHAIPIYGLVANKNNKVKLVGNDGSSKELEIQTDEYPDYVEINKNELKESDDLYFVSSPIDLGYAAFNTNGELVWNINIVSGQDMEFLSNGHLLISNEDVNGFYEVDYLGKIYKSYVLENEYHHDMQELSNNKLLVAGIERKSPLLEDYIYIIDKDSGAKQSDISLYEIINRIDSDYADSIRGKDLIINSVELNENSRELLISIRGLNTIMSLNYDNKSINWMIAEKDQWSSAFAKYILTASDASRIPMGAHSAFISKDGYIGVFNNDYDVNRVQEYKLSQFVDNYASATYYKINKSDMTYSTVWNYIDDDNVFNYAMGNFAEINDGHKLVDFGWSFGKSSYQNNAGIYNDDFGAYSRIVELDENNKVIFRARMDLPTYRVYKNRLYNGNTPNFKVEDVKIINTTPYSELEEIETKSIQNSLDNAVDTVYNINVSETYVSINVSFDILDEADIVLVGNDGKSYIYNYKKKDAESNGKINIKLNGTYKIYFVMNGIYYKTNKEVTLSYDPNKYNGKESDTYTEDVELIPDTEDEEE